jgi:tetratricopeptide (TPR) repeat protein
MKLRPLLFFLFFSVFFNTPIWAQDISIEEQHELDSLKKELLVAKHDTDKIKLLYDIGDISIDRLSFWDSLVNSTKKYKLFMYEYKSYLCMAAIHEQSKNKEGVIKYLSKSLQLAEEKKYNEQIRLSAVHLALNYKKIFDFRNAIDNFFKALRIAELQKDNEQIGYIRNTLAETYLIMGETSKAIELRISSLQYYKLLNNYKALASAYLGIGDIYEEVKDYKKMSYYYMESSKYLKEFPDNNIYSVRIYNAMGAAYASKHLYDSAFIYSNKAYEMALAINDKGLIASVLTGLAMNNYDRGFNKKAKEQALKVWEITKELGFKRQIPIISRLLKKIYQKDKNFEEALKYHEIYVNYKDSTSNEKNQKIALEKQFSFDFEKKENQNKLLAQQNQIQLLQINQTKFLVIGVVGLALLILIIAFLVIRQNKIKANQQSLQMEQRLISAQMNPHFVFNSLNAIQQLIMSKENEKAEFYLSKFAKLIRELLESNTKESLTLKEETDILNGYLEMESKRFNKSFNYSVQIDEKINPETANIPHMMVQPFVENAIWHGLLPKSGERHLAINYTYENEKTICCTIEDNGIGREAAQKKQATFKRKSLALSFVKQRLDLMRETLKVNCSVEIIDKKTNTGESLGTKINIILPLLH